MPMTSFPHGIDLSRVEADLGTTEQPGGTHVELVAGGAINYRDTVMVSTAANRTVLQGTNAGHTRGIGVCAGRVVNGAPHLGENVASGERAIVQVAGIALCVAGAAITAGDQVATGATTAGRIEDLSVSNETPLGVALDTVAAAGDEVQVILLHGTATA